MNKREGGLCVHMFVLIVMINIKVYVMNNQWMI